MKSKFLLTFLACFLLSFSFASGQEISLDNITGTMWNGQPDSVMAGSTYVFDMRFNNTSASTISGFTTNFHVYSPDGATWTNTVGDSTGAMNNTHMGGGIFIAYANSGANITGSGADTVTFGGFTIFGGGLLPGYNEVPFTVQIGPIGIDDGGKTICIDSLSYPQNAWKWVEKGAPDITPAWDGPHCFDIRGEIIDPPPNTPPVLDVPSGFIQEENILLEFDVSATDADGDPIALTTSPLPTGAIFNDNGDGTGDFTWTPSYTQDGIYNIIITAFDGTDSTIDTVVVTIQDAPQGPSISPVAIQTVNENELLEFTVTAVDLDGLFTPELVAENLPSGASFTDNGDGTGLFSWTPNFDQADTLEVTFIANIGLAVAIEYVTINIHNVNRQPRFVAYADDAIIDEGQPFFILHEITDIDFEDVITRTTTTLPDGATFEETTPVNSRFDWTPGFDQAGDYQIIFTVSDGELSDVDTVNITVNDFNQAPVLDSIRQQSVTAGEVLFIHVMSSDGDGNPLTLSADPLPGTAELVDSGNGNGFFRWATEIADSGSYDVTFTTSDGEFIDLELVTIIVGEAPKMIVVDTNFFVSTYTIGEFYSDTAKFNVSELNGSAISVDIITTGQAGLSITGPNPLMTPSLLEIAIDPMGLSVGEYRDSVILNSDVADNEQVMVILLNVVERANTVAYIVSPTDTLFTTDECTPLDINFVTTDDEEDPITISMIGLVENMTFLDNGDGTADFNFVPNFSQAGLYPLALVLFDGRDSAQYQMSIIVDSCSPGTEGDTVTVATVPAVPGARVTVPVDIANLCDLDGLNISVGWTSSNVTLDSVSFVDSRLNSLFSWLIDTNVDSNHVTIFGGWAEIPVFLSPGSGNMANLHFSLEVGTPAGFYPLDFYMEPNYNRNCGGGVEGVRPFFISGGIVVDTSGNYVCGYVVDPEGSPVPGATVELWDNFPSGSAQSTQDASGNGVFAFDDFITVPFDLYAYHEGFYPGRVENINFAQSGIMIVLTPIPEFATPTNTWVDFFCGTNTFKNSPLPVGSVVEAYDPDGVKCGEFVVHTAGEYGFMHVYGDDEFTDADEGAVPDDVIRFFVNGIEAITGAPAIWTEDRAQFEVCLDVPDVTPHSCFLTAGWNLVSWNVDTDVDDIANVLSSIDDCVEIVMGYEQGALTYDATLPQFSDLWNVDHLSAYWIKVSCDVELVVLGTPVPSTTPIPVTAGWNLVSYLPADEMPTELALTTIHSDLVVALGYEADSGRTYLPGQNEFNDLTTMSSCYGYWVKVLNSGTLIYPDGGADSVFSKTMYTQTSSSTGRIDATTSWMNIYAYDLKMNDVQVKSGASIKAFNKENVLVGSYEMKQNGKFGFMPIYGDDAQTDKVDGMKSGDEFYLTVDGVETAEKFTWSTSGDKLEIRALSAKLLEGSLPTSFELAQNYPNPFNPSTTISFALPVSGNAKVEIFNLLGQLIATPFDEAAAAGQHIVTWDGRSDNGKTVASGIYFYRLTADNFTDTKKMTLLK